jgi:NADP-dependent 3-hydroxy acid dehydrogenase YdfG
VQAREEEMRHRFDLAGEIAVVTGAASGIGRAIAASVAAVREERLQEC